MDHNYRNNTNGSNGGRSPGRGRAGFTPSYVQPEPEPLPQREDAASRIFAFVDDLFFLSKIQDTARKLNVKVEFVKTDKDISLPGALPRLDIDLHDSRQQFGTDGRLMHGTDRADGRFDSLP